MVAVILIVFTVDVLLLSAAEGFLGGALKPLRVLVGACLGALFAAFCMVPGFSFLDHFLWHLCSLVLTGLLAFGFSRETIRKLLLFIVLHLSLEGIADGKQELLSMLLGAAGIGFACIAVGRHQKLITVELTYGTQTLQFKALRDTGNTLRDPITGKQVLIVGADVAEKLTGLTVSMLRDPVGSIHAIPGLRLIPYKTVGNTGFMLALRLEEVKIGNRQGNALVAFSPLVLGSNYKALTGGSL